MGYEVLFTGGKKKALTFSYDDGQIFDRKLVDIFNRYDLKATFHLNSGTLDGGVFIKKEEVPSLYKGHEVAVHGVKHLWPSHLSQIQLVNEILEDRRELERILHKPITGMSYAFGNYSDEIVNTIKTLGIEYSRTVNSTNSFVMPEDFMRWKPTCHHNADLMKLADDFLKSPGYRRLEVFYIWGHSFEFERENTWEKMEKFCQYIAHKDEVWYTTNMEIKQYVTAMRALVFSVDETYVYNPTAISVWMNINGKLTEVKAGMTVSLVEN